MSKVIVWAHNEHIKKSDNTMGHHLSKSLKDDDVNIGFAINEGSFTANSNDGIKAFTLQKSFPGTFEYLFNQLKEQVFLLDLRSLKRENQKESQWLKENMLFRNVGAAYTELQFTLKNIAADYDIIIFINKSSPTTQL